MSIHNILVENDLAIYASSANISRYIKFAGDDGSYLSYDSHNFTVNINYGPDVKGTLNLTIIKTGVMCSIFLTQFSISIGASEGGYAIALEMSQILGTKFAPRYVTTNIIMITQNGANFVGRATMDLGAQLTFYLDVNESGFAASSTAGLSQAVVFNYESANS